MTSTFTPQSWALELLEDVNNDAPGAAPVPIDATTEQDVLQWMPAEEPVSDWYDRNNPLNASLGTSASDGTGSYPDLNTGANETALMIDQGNMSGIRSALAADDPPTEFSAAVVSSPWAGSNYGVAAAGAPAKYVVPGRGLNYIATTTPGGGAAPASAGVPGATPANSAQLADATLTGYNLNPFDLFGIPQTIAGDAASSLWGEIGPFVVKSLLVVAGLGVMVLGLSKATDAGSKLKGAVQQAAPLAEVAAA